VADGGVVALEYASPEGASQLRAHMLLRESDEIVAGENPSIRNAGEDDRNLDKHMRPFAMVRSTGGASDFVSVLEPIAGEPQVAEVRPLDLPGTEVALEIELPGRSDLVLLDASGVDAQWHGRDLSADAEMVILRAPGDAPAQMTVTAGSASWGDLRAERAATEHALLSVDRDARSITVEGDLPAAPGEVIMLDHAGERVSPYNVIAVESEGANTRLIVAEDPGITWDAEASASSFVFVPHTTHEGPHTVSVSAVAHAGE
jgi:hypothetical protein